MDEVLIETFANLYAWHNETYGTDLTVERDCKHFAQWLNRGFGDYTTFQTKFDRWSTVAHQQKIILVANAVETLREIKALGYRLVIITSRRPELAVVSRDLVQSHFPDIFDEMWFCAGFRNQSSRDQMDPIILHELFGNQDARKDSTRSSSVFVEKRVRKNFEKQFGKDDSGSISSLATEALPRNQHGLADARRRSLVFEETLSERQHAPDERRRRTSIFMDGLLGKQHTEYDSQAGSSRRSFVDSGSTQVIGRPVAVRWMEGPKSIICKTVGATALIDDSIHNALEVVNHGPIGIRVALFGAYLWNRHWTDMSREEFARSYGERVNTGYVDDLSLTVLPDAVKRCSTWTDVLHWLER